MAENGKENLKEKRRAVTVETTYDVRMDNSNEDKFNNMEQNAKRTNKQKEQIIAIEPYEDNNMSNEHDNERALNKIRYRKNRELGELEENQILSSRLRSSSGKVYSSSVSVEAAGSQNTSPANSLVTVAEEEISNLDSEMCPKEGCCNGTVKIMEMIAKLQQSVDGVLKKVTTQETVTSNNSHRVFDLQEKVAKNEEGIDDMERDLKETKFQLQVVSNIVIKQDEQIKILSNKISQMQQREMAANIVISGIPETKQERPIQLFNNFVQHGLELQELIPANRAFRIGVGANRPLLVELRHPENKGRLFANAVKLKGKKNEKGGSYFISDHLPEDQNESRRRINELVAENKRKPSSHKLDMQISKGTLLINEEPYEKSVKAPSARDLIEPNEKLFDKAEELDIVKGGRKIQEQSKFYSFAVAVQDFEDVQAALLQTRMKFADATHVSCAFRLPGANTPFNQDYVDDGEFGCGRTMLKVLREEKYMNMAVFIVRYYGGKHLGPARYDTFRELAKDAIRALMSKREKEEEKNMENRAASPLPERFEQPDFPFEQGEVPTTEEWGDANKSD